MKRKIALNNIRLIIVLIIVFYNCKAKPSMVKTKQNNLRKNFDYSKIETNPKSVFFNHHLIDTLFVEKHDTVLFRKESGYKSLKGRLINKNFKLELRSGTAMSYYKTGNTTFSSYPIYIKNLVSHKLDTVYLYVNNGIIRRISPYYLSTIPLATLYEADENLIEFILPVHFGVDQWSIFIRVNKKGKLEIVKLHREASDLNDTEKELDTIILIKKFIDVKTLRFKL